MVQLYRARATSSTSSYWACAPMAVAATFGKAAPTRKQNGFRIRKNSCRNRLLLLIAAIVSAYLILFVRASRLFSVAVRPRVLLIGRLFLSVRPSVRVYFSSSVRPSVIINYPCVCPSVISISCPFACRFL